MDTILFVDDEPNVIVSFKRQLRGEYEILGCNRPRDALQTLADHREVSVIIADMQMPEMNGVQLLQEVSKKFPDVIRVILTGNNDQQTAVKAINEGDIFRFINKPCSIEQISGVLKDCSQHHQMLIAEKDLLKNTLGGAIRLLTDLHGMINPLEYQSNERVRERVRQLTAIVPVKSAHNLELAALLCNLGKFAIPPEIIAKERAGTPLSSDETELIRRYPEISASLLRHIPRLTAVADIILHHRRNANGSGSTGTIPSSEVPLGARILRIAQDYESLLQNGMSEDAVVDLLSRSPDMYDPAIVKLIKEQRLSKGEEVQCNLPDYTVDLEGLMPGQYLTQEVKTITGTLLLNRGYMITPAVIAKLRNYHKVYGLVLPIHVNGLIPTN